MDDHSPFCRIRSVTSPAVRRYDSRVIIIVIPGNRMNEPPISRYPVPKLEDLPDDVRARMLEVQEKAGFIPNVFVTLAHRPDEFRAFLIC
jgi:pyruvate/oxaloacetate carboxyltransferase